LQETGTSHDIASEESSVDVAGTQGTVWSDFSWDPAEEEDFDPMSLLTADVGENAAVLDPEHLNMDMSPALASWSHSSSSGGTQQGVIAPPKPLSPTPVWPASTDSSSHARKYSAGCQCLHTMAQLLEDKGAHWSDKGVDTLLMCVGCGIRAYEEALSCANCNICAENGMLLAMVAQCLSAAATGVASKLCPVGNSRLSGVAGEVFDGPILFGCYRMEIPKVRSSLVYNTAQQHLADLRTLMSRIKDRMGLKWGAVEVIAEAEDVVVKSHFRVHQLLESSKT
jgi:hypothetical protein